MKIDVVNGLLGAGKTTYLLNLLTQKEPNEKLIVLVNEFGEVGIDGDILSGQGAGVVELPNGCICCTLTADLRSQIKEIAEEFQPDRLLIEPTGIATIKNLLGILKSLSLEKYIDDISVTLVIDAASFREIIAQNRGFVETQMEAAEVIVVNKCDRVDDTEIGWITDFIRHVNSKGHILLTIHGMITKDLTGNEGHKEEDSLLGTLGDIGPAAGPEVPLKRYEQFSTSSNAVFDINKLRILFREIKDDGFGSIERAKGIFRIAGNEWVRIDLASHEINEKTIKNEFQSSKIIVIGTNLSKDILKERFIGCHH